MALRLIGGLLLVIVMATSPVHAQTAAVPQISAVGVGELRVAPDYALAVFTVETSGTDAARAGRENAARMASLRQGLEKQGIPPAAISTVGDSVRNEARFQGRGPKGEPNWFVARNGIRVEVARLEQLGAIIDAALASGANHVDSIAFLARDERELRRKALAMAVEQARAQAEAMAAAAGGRLGELIELAAGEGPSFPRPLYAERAVAAGTVVEVAEITIIERVASRWRFAAGAP